MIYMYIYIYIYIWYTIVDIVQHQLYEKDFGNPCFWVTMIPSWSRGIVVVSSDPVLLPLLDVSEL